MLFQNWSNTYSLCYKAIAAVHLNRTKRKFFVLLIFLISASIFYQKVPQRVVKTIKVTKPVNLNLPPIIVPNNVTYGLIENEKYLMLTDLNEHMNCFLLMVDNAEAMKVYKAKGRLVYTEEPFLFMECSSIQMRVMSIAHMQRPKNIPYAVVRTVHSDYHVQEYLLGQNYAIHNVYCFVFHRNATDSFRMKMRQMEQCFENVKILEEDFDIHHGNGQQIRAYLACNSYLIDQPKWKYALYLENSDVITKTNTEISKILWLVNGTQLLGTNKPMAVNASRPLPTARKIGLFDNETEYGLEYQLDTPINLVESVAQVFLSRAFIEVIDRKLNVDNLIVELNSHQAGADSLLFATLAYAYHLGLPGQTKHICWSTSKGPVLTDNYYLRCENTTGSCPLRMENVYHLRWLPSIVASHIDATVDFGMLICHSRVLKFRAIRETLDTPGYDFYYSLQQVIEGFERRFPSANSMFVEGQNRCTNL